MVSALLIGGRVTVPIGADVGGSFEHLPACRSANQIGCVVGYSSFDATPPPDSLFGRIGELGSSILGAADPDTDEVLCVNPGNLSSGTGELTSYFRTTPFPGTLGAVEPPLFPLEELDEPTPWVQVPDQYTAECKHEDGVTWLQIDHDPSDPRPAVSPTLGPAWGLHLVDVNLALGNLVDLVRTQAKAYAAK
jgi:hypothetical protein